MTTTCAAPGIARADAESAATIIGRLGLVEAPTAVRERPQWSPPQRIVVRNVAPGLIEALAPAAPGVTLVPVDTARQAADEARTAQAVLGFCSDEIVAANPRLAWIGMYSAGVERCVDLPGVRDGRVLLTNMQRVAGPVMAEHGLAMLLALSRGLHVYASLTREARWDPSFAERGGARTLEGKTLLVAGLGGIGEEVARRAHALGMTVIATRGSDRPAPAFVAEVGRPDRLLEFAARADAVVAALPLTPATRNLFDARFFAALKPGAFFVNLGRGQSVDQSALAAALGSGRLAGAGLDVTDPEPLPADHPLWRAPNLLITPHVSAESDLGLSVHLAVLRENLRRYVAGERMLNVVDATRGY
jgi:phosphoglycerate dehydrogenase-like enzyme